MIAAELDGITGDTKRLIADLSAGRKLGPLVHPTATKCRLDAITVVDELFHPWLN
jgi:hypothetical protein